MDLSEPPLGAIAARLIRSQGVKSFCTFLRAQAIKSEKLAKESIRTKRVMLGQLTPDCFDISLIDINGIARIFALTKSDSTLLVFEQES